MNHGKEYLNHSSYGTVILLQPVQKNIFYTTSYSLKKIIAIQNISIILSLDNIGLLLIGLMNYLFNNSNSLSPSSQTHQ